MIEDLVDLNIGGSVNDLAPSVSKALSEPVLTMICDVIWRHWVLMS